MTDIYLDTSTGDLGTNTDGDDLRIATDIEELAQRVFAALEVRRGEWVFDTRLGLPYERFWARPTVLPEIEAEIENTLLGIDGVLSVSTTSISLDRASRRLSITVQVVGRAGTIALTGKTAGEQKDIEWRAAGGW